jgi:hypothetical protein
MYICIYVFIPISLTGYPTAAQARFEQLVNEFRVEVKVADGCE